MPEVSDYWLQPTQQEVRNSHTTVPGGDVQEVQIPRDLCGFKTQHIHVNCIRLGQHDEDGGDQQQDEILDHGQHATIHAGLD